MITPVAFSVISIIEEFASFSVLDDSEHDHTYLFIDVRMLFE